MAGHLAHLESVPSDFYELAGALAPRPFFINAPLRDSNFKWDSVDRIVDAARAVYAIHGAPQNIQVRHPDCEHDFPDAERSEAYTWIARTLGRPD